MVKKGIIRCNHGKKHYGFDKEIMKHQIFVKDYEDYSVVKNALFSKLLEDDEVDFEIDEKKKELIIKNILFRKPKLTIGIVRAVMQNEKMVFIKLPFLSDTFSFSYSLNDMFLEVGDILYIIVNTLGIDILKKEGNIRNLNDVKIAIGKLLESTDAVLIKEYQENLPQKTDNNLFDDTEQDLTYLHTFSVDTDGTKDFDDAISIDTDANKIYVHIVDIEKFITVGDTEDIQALNQGFSLYLPDKLYSCIERSISINKISLLEKKERQTITTEFTYDPESYEIVSSKIYPSKVLVSTNYSYDDFDCFCETTDSQTIQVIKAFQKKWDLFTIHTPYLKISIQNGFVKGKEIVKSLSLGQKFIEQMMILTNSTIAQKISEKNGTFINRKHPKKIREETYKELSSQKFCDNEIVNDFMQHKVSKNHLVPLKETGHFGLDMDFYTHFTSPIRRYSDIINHRTLWGYKYDNSLYSKIIDHLITQEKMIYRISDWYYNLVFRKFLKVTKKETFEAYITEVHSHGLIFYIPELLYENYIHISKIYNSSGKWNYNHDTETLSNFTQKIKKGQKVKLTLENITIFNIFFYLLLE